MGLWETSGRGRPQRWSETDLAFLETCLDEELRIYTTQQLANYLHEPRQVKFSADRSDFQKKT
ncbi:MAG: helix-turn-helix domain-containing protein [Cyanobacteria bacterium P01_G01_bin.4]